MSEHSIPGLGNAVVPFLQHLDVRPIRLEDGSFEFYLKVDQHHLRPYGIIHGGVVASLLDTSLGQTAGAAAGEKCHVVTVQLNINYIRPTWEGEEVIARAELQHQGRKTAVCRGELRTLDDKLIATATGTFMYLPAPAGSKIVKEKQE